MQQCDRQTLYFRKKLGEIIRRIRKDKTGLSCSKLSNEYGLNDSNLGKIERAIIDCKVVTLWKISEALGLKLSDFIKILEAELGEDFKLIEE